MSEWQPIETAPKDGTEVLLWTQLQRSIGRPAYRYRADVGYWCAYGWSTGVSDQVGKSEAPTHWMPLPDPPKDGE